MTSTTPDTPNIAARAGDEEPIPVAIAWPTGRLIYAYTRQELAAGVDLYTRAMKARAAQQEGSGDA